MPDEIHSTPTEGEPLPSPAVGSDRGRVSIQELLDNARSRLDRVEPEKLEAEQAAGALVVDIRSVEQRRRDGPIPGALIIDRNVLEWRLDPASPHCIPQTGYDRCIIIVCNEGYSSTLAAAILRTLGLHNATDLAGGFQGWRRLRGHSD
jgi:rhodanese-related sulfurtransferase